jgi:5-methylcytosine-specific restriction protein A
MSGRDHRARNREYEQHRSSPRERGYTTRWQKARKTYLMSHPLCVMCKRDGRVTPATVVDHIRSHKGDQQLFWDTGNWQPLCKPHHDRDKQREERSRFQAVDADGWPT